MKQYDIVEKLGVRPLWELGYRGDGVTIAVLDSGMFPHPTFAEKIVYDEDFTGHQQPRDKSSWHGNSIADCILAIAPDASIANCRIKPTNSGIKREVVVEALQHCIDVYPKYRIVNLSISFEPNGCPDNCLLCQKVDEAYRKGILITVAAGNKGPESGTLTCPALAKWAMYSIGTGPSFINDYYYKGYKGWLRRTWKIHLTGEFAKKFGTSYSAAYRSGASAVLFSAFPKLDADTLRYATLEVGETMRREGYVTRPDTYRVYQYLLYLRMYVSTGAFVVKEGALYPFLKDF